MRLVAALALGTAAALRPVAAPVVVGGGATAAALYGKLQRYEAVFDSGLARGGQPNFTVLQAAHCLCRRVEADPSRPHRPRATVARRVRERDQRRR